MSLMIMQIVNMRDSILHGYRSRGEKIKYNIVIEVYVQVF